LGRTFFPGGPRKLTSGNELEVSPWFIPPKRRAKTLAGGYIKKEQVFY